MFKLTEKQQEIVDSNARIKLVMGASRSGKTLVTIKTLEKEMKKLNSKETKVAIYEFPGSHSRVLMNEIKKLMRDLIYTIYKEKMIIVTTYGTIEIKEYQDGDEGYDIVVIDAASRNKYIEEILRMYNNGITRFIITGHCPEDINNYFYKLWCSAFYSSITDMKAFKLRTYDNPAIAHKKEEWEKEFLSRMSLERYIRDYYATII